MMIRLRLVALCAAAILGLHAPAFAQARGGRPPAVAEGISPAELQRMFDAYALMQAQEQLNISDDQYAPFLARFKALQDVRRKSLQERTRVIQSLRKLLNAEPTDEAQIKDQLKALQDLEARAVSDVKKAYDAVDQVLTPPQQARFRIFEENMERRKLELVARARQANRQKKQL